MGFPHSSDGKESACSAEDLGSIPGSGQSPGVGNGNPLQYPCLENPMDRGGLQSMGSQSRARLSDFRLFLSFFGNLSNHDHTVLTKSKPEVPSVFHQMAVPHQGKGGGGDGSGGCILDTEVCDSGIFCDGKY